MITCNRCGNMTPAGPVCQMCGAPLSSKMDAGFSQRAAAQEQSELPAWLESLRAGERPAASAGPANFSTADLMDDGPLPSWMRSAREETANASDPSMPDHLAAFSHQAPDGGRFPPSGLAAQSLIDEKSLPSWMKEGAQPPPVPGSISASSLLQQGSVPDWMKTLQESAHATPPTAGPQGQAERFEQPARPMTTSSPELGRGFSARDLIDQQSLPSWMAPQGERAGAAPRPEPASQPLSGQPLSGQPLSGQPLSGQPLSGQPLSGQPLSGQPLQGMLQQQNGFSASSLLDVDALPQWMRQGGQDRQDGRANAAPPQPAWPVQTPPNSSWPTPTGMQSNPAWPGTGSQTPPPMSVQPPSPTANPGQSGVSASSFIDASALPEWLRKAGDQYPQTGQPSQPGGVGVPRQASYAIPPRAENVRVPSRPRGSEAGANESSEMAANVFASMLGVASTAPNYPGEIAPGQYQRPDQSNQPPAMPSGSLQNSGMLANSSLGVGPTPAAYGPMNNAPANTPYIPGAPGSNAHGMPGMSNTPGATNMPGMANAQGMPGYGNSYGGNSYGGNNQGLADGSPSAGPSSYYPGNAAAYPGNVGSPSSPAQTAGAAGDQKHTKKRGLFGAFLDWLSR